MNFRQATDALFSRVSHADLARALGVSVALIRQSRLRTVANAHRSPPEQWREAILRLAEERVRYYHQLVDKLTKNHKP